MSLLASLRVTSKQSCSFIIVVIEQEQNPSLGSLKERGASAEVADRCWDPVMALHRAQLTVIVFPVCYQNTTYSSPTELCMLVNLIKS